MDEPIPQSAAFRIQLPTFEGPLDLLLHLIKKHELDVLELPIAFVTERYLEYLSMMQELDLDVASEYLLMAATLAHIKSKSLLPSAPNDALEEQDDGYQEDPRAELIRRLLEYQKYKAAGEQLGARPLAGRDVFPRGMSAPEAQGPAPLAGIDLYKLLDAFQGILKRVHGRAALEVTAERITIHERISELSDLLSVRRSCTFEELFDSARTRYEVVVTFLALLEMTKLRITRIYQADPTAAIHVHYALLDADSPSVVPDAGSVDAAFASASPPMAAEDSAFASAANPDVDSAFDSSISDADELAAEDLQELGEPDEPETLEALDEHALSPATDEVAILDELEASVVAPEWHANLAADAPDAEFALADTEVTSLPELVGASHEAQPSEREHPDTDPQSFDDEVTQQHVHHEHDESKP